MGKKGRITRRAIIEKSLQLFSVKGYHHTSLNDILEATTLTKGGLYGHFESKEAIWHAAYDEAVAIWKRIVFKDLEAIEDPIQRIEKALENDLRHYLGGDVFAGGCIFLNMLVELSGQAPGMGDRVLNGILGFSGVFEQWLYEAKRKKMLKPGVNIEEISDFIVITLNGCAALYAASKNSKTIDTTLSQLVIYLEQVKK
jgi:AcrR family transcriptional regulator